MVAEKFGPHHKTILNGKNIDAIYELWGVSYPVEIELPEDDEIPENGYCGAYASHFEAGGLSFPLPRFLLEVLAEIRMEFTQMAPNFFRYFLGCWVRALEEGLEFCLGELRQLFDMKRNNGFPGTMILAPQGGRGIIEGIPNKGDRWREKFFVFKINSASVGDFDFERIPREWKKEKEGLLDRPDESSEAGSLERARKVQRGRVFIPRSQVQSSGLLARSVSVAIPSCGALEAPDTSVSFAGDRALNDEIDSSSHRSRRQVLEEINSVTSGSLSPRLSPPLRASGEGTSRVNPGVLPLSVPEAFSWSFAYDSEIPILENPDSLAAKVRAEGCELPSLDHMRERDAYVQMAVANAKLRGELDAAREAERQREVEIEELKKKLAAAEAEKVVVQRDLDSMKEKYRGEIEGRDRKARKDLHLARVSLAKEYEGVLAMVKGKLEKKKKETAAEILLQKTRARIEALTEYSEGGFELEAELERLKDLEVSVDVDYGLASVSDPSLGHLDLPEISGDSVNQD
ncbi:PREDICTED: uncharacterized protein LOC106324049 [Brassica oleracea var. oleracea]|uniref:uncharacterized protein LOC106324049 n=1 Tax=Brassica oleracea var. oleracea TaxID=109376 RepID=UPI0006A6C7D1|nr:PREDICTED: uncharacterized protein LOC106324049 [Brassica oleracea var. oleracea]